MPLKIIFDNSFSEENKSQVLSVLKRAVSLSKCNREIYLSVIDDKKDTYALTDWPLKLWFKKPIVKLTKTLLKQDKNTIGYTLTHELIHCRQGFWKILWQNIYYAVTFKKGFPPFEIEAYDSINLWYEGVTKNAR